MRVLIVVVLLVLMAAAVNAYTIVMHDGRRVEIPNEFVVTDKTITYAVGSGLQITIQLAGVDIAATERANGQPDGSLLFKATAPKTQVPVQTRKSAERSITNRDLETYRRAREQNEEARKELGLPSVEERRREVADIEDRTVEQVRSMRAEEEAYWRSRADALRAEIAANEALIQPLRQRPEELPLSYSFGGFPGFFPLDGVGFGITTGSFNRFRRFPPSPFGPVFSTPIPSPFSGFLATPITPFPTFPFTPVFRGRVRINPRPINPGRGSHR